MKLLLFIVCLSVLPCFAQNDTLNQIDENGWKQGYWIYYGKDRPELDYPRDGKIEEGRYKDNRKDGEWIKYHHDGITPKLRGFYENNRPNGPYQKIYANGVIQESGSFLGGKYSGDLRRYNPNGTLRYFGSHNENGISLRDSFFIYRNEYCRDSVITYDYIEKSRFVIDYSKDSCNLLLQKTKRNYTPRFIGCTFERTGTNDIPEPYVPNDTVIESHIQPTYVIQSADQNEVSRILTESYPQLNQSIQFQYQVEIRQENWHGNGIQRVYNINKDLFLEGEFKNYQFMNGKVYEYDRDGILLKVKIYKKGNYHSDGQL